MILFRLNEFEVLSVGHSPTRERSASRLIRTGIGSFNATDKEAPEQKKARRNYTNWIQPSTHRGMAHSTPSRRDWIRAVLADLKMTGALEALNSILHRSRMIESIRSPALISSPGSR